MCRGLGTKTVCLASVAFQSTGMGPSKTAVTHAQAQARAAGVNTRFWAGSALDLPFDPDELDFILDMRYLHHIWHPDSDRFIHAILRVLKNSVHYFTICFSDKNGPAWKHFSDKEILDIFSLQFDAMEMRHFFSLEGDGRIRFFYATLFRSR